MLVDSNIIIYSLNSASPKHKTAQEFLESRLDEMYIAHQNILESYRVLTHPKFPNPMPPKKAASALEALTRSFSVIYPNYDTLHIALALIDKHVLVADAVFDAYLTATALSNGITTIATDNQKDFEKFTEISVFNPFGELKKL